jgi:hypothetical protein
MCVKRTTSASCAHANLFETLTHYVHITQACGSILRPKNVWEEDHVSIVGSKSDSHMVSKGMQGWGSRFRCWLVQG